VFELTEVSARHFHSTVVNIRRESISKGWQASSVNDGLRAREGNSLRF
jgi:hypothetical protein